MLAIYSVTRVVHRGRRDCQVGPDDRGNERGELLSSPVVPGLHREKEVHWSSDSIPNPRRFQVYFAPLRLTGSCEFLLAVVSLRIQ